MVAGGLEQRGARVRYAGVITTPGVAYLTRTGPFVAGVMISASHNPYRDNGLKVFGHTGFKLPDAEEHVIEQEIFRLRDGRRAAARRPTLAVERELDRQYLEYLLSTAGVRLDGVSIVLDCGNGAAYRLAPELFRRLGADVSVHQRRARRPQHQPGLRRAPPGRPARGRARARGADFGAAFDGDADRAIFVARSGKVVDGDAVLLACRARAARPRAACAAAWWSPP